MQINLVYLKNSREAQKWSTRSGRPTAVCLVTYEYNVFCNQYFQRLELQNIQKKDITRPQTCDIPRRTIVVNNAIFPKFQMLMENFVDAVHACTACTACVLRELVT